MKRILIFASAAIVALASCAKTEVVYKDAPQEIAFKQITGPMTKDTQDLSHDIDLGVLAFKNADKSVYFGNTLFEHDGNSWSANKYWPVSGKLDFILYAPFNNTADVVKSTYTNAEQKLVISIDNQVTQTDWLYADKLYAEVEKTNTAINVIMKHALAKIFVTLKSDLDNVVTIKSFEIIGTNQKSDLTIIQNTTSNTIEWGTMTTKDWLLSDLAHDTNKLDKTTGREDECLVIPGNQTSFKMVYTLEGIAAEQTYTHTFDSSLNWEAGHKYIYNIVIGVNEITFDCDEVVWEETENPLEWVASVN